MVQTEEEKKAYRKAYRAKNKEKHKAYQKAYRDNNKEETKVYQKAYYANNKEKASAYNTVYRANNKDKMSAYRDNNKEKKNAYDKAYNAQNKEKVTERKRKYNLTPEGLKSSRISSWKYCGVLGNLSKIYDERYLPSTACEVCNKTYKSSKDRCLDHDHDTGLFRQVLCQECNVHDNWKKKEK